MCLCDRHYTATQFALLSAVAAVGRIVTGPFAGIAVKTMGWTEFFLLSFFITIPGLILLLHLRPALKKLVQVSPLSEEKITQTKVAYIDDTHEKTNPA